MARIGLDKLTLWKITKDDNTGLTYGTPVHLGKAIKASIKPKVVSSELYGDDALAETYSAVTGYDLQFDITDFPPSMQAMLLGYKSDSNGMVELAPDAEAPYFALAYRSALSTGGYSYHNMLKVRFEPSDEEFETRGQNVNFQTQKLTAKAVLTENTGKFGYNVRGTAENKADVADKWFGQSPVTKLKED